MEKKHIFMQLGGTWDEEKQCYNGGRLKGIQVPCELTYIAPRELVYKVIKVNASNVVSCVISWILILLWQ